MAGVTYHLRDRGVDLTAAWQRHFAGVAEVVPVTGDIFGVPVDAVVSPAHCFGFMDGGMLTSPRNNLGFKTVGGFESDGERDARKTADSDEDLAWVRPGREKSGTQKNLERRRRLRSTREATDLSRSGSPPA